MKTLYSNIRTIYTINILLVALFWGGEVVGQTSSNPVGFENNSVNGFTGGSGTETATINSTTVRTGSKSVALKTTSASANKYWYTNTPYGASAVGTYVHFIYWAKASVASTSVDASINYKTSTPPSGAGTAVAGTALPLSTGAWTRIFFNAGNVNTRWYFPAPKKTSGTATTFYIDDIIIYTSLSPITDIESPGFPLDAKGTNTNGLSWTNGNDIGDGATGIQKTLIFKRTAGSNGSNDLTLNSQAIFSLVSTEGPKIVGNWTLQSNTVLPSATTYTSGSFTIGEEYAIVHRDLAYNYSLPTYVVITAPTPIISIKEIATNTSYANGSFYDMGTRYNNSTVSKTYRLYNKGAGTLNISSCALSSGVKFSKTGSPSASVNEGDSTTLTILFSPGNTSGIFTDVLTIASNDATSPYIINFKGGRANFVLPYTYQSACTSPEMSASALTHDYTVIADIPSIFTLGTGSTIDDTHFYRNYKAFQSEGSCMPNNSSTLRIGQGNNALKLALTSCGTITLKWCANGYRKVKITDNTGNIYEQSAAYLPGFNCYTTQTVVNKNSASTMKIEFLGNDTNLVTSLYYLQITPYDNSVKSSAKNIIEFSSGVGGEKVHIYDNLVSISVPAGTNLSTITPSLIRTSPDASVFPGQSVTKDFTNDQVYTVTAEDGTTKTYTVSIKYAVNYGSSYYADSIVIPINMNSTDKKIEILEVVNNSCNIPVSGNGANYTLHFLDENDLPATGYQIDGVKEICIGSTATYRVKNAPETNKPQYKWHLSGANKNLFTIIGDTISETLTLKAPDEYTISNIDFEINVEFLPCNCQILKGLDTLSLRVTKDPPDKITGLVADCSVDGMLAITGNGSNNATSYNWTFSPSYPIVLQDNNIVVLNIGTNYSDIAGKANTQNGCGVTEDTQQYNIDYATVASKWTGAIDNDWSKHANWSARVPKACTDVTIPNVGNGIQYPTIGVSGICHYITFEPGGAVLGLQKLTYERAYVQLGSQRLKWYTLTAPLKNMYSADYAYQGSPVTNMRLFDQINPDSIHKSGALNIGNWSRGFSAGDVALSPGIGYAYWVDTKTYNYPNPITYITGNITNYFPRETSPDNLMTQAWTYSTYSGRLLTSISLPRDPSKAYRFAMENANGVLQDIKVPIKVGLNLVGNPLMTHLDFNALHASNSNVISNKVKFWNGTTFTTFMSGSGISSSMNLASTSIPPMQAFFVEGLKNDTMLIDLDTHFIADLVTKLRSANATPNLMHIITNNGTKQSSTAIALRSNASNSFGDDDAFKLFSQYNDVPEVYSVADEIALDINQFDTLPYTVPLGLKTTTQGTVNYTFDGAESFNNIDVTLLNTRTGEQQNLKTSSQYNLQYDGTNPDGYLFIEFRNANTTTETNQIKSCNRCIQVYQKDSKTIGVVSPAKDKIKNITVWEQSGKMLYNRFEINKSFFDVEVLPHQACVVRVATETSTYVVKLLMK